MNRYSVDKFNRLVVKGRGEPATAKGNFEIDRLNRLVYLLNEPVAWRRKYELPGRIIFTGRWKLTADNDLKLDLDNKHGQNSADTLILKGRLVKGEAESLLFEIHGLKSSYDSGEYYFRLLRLSGFWHLDTNNRINFSISKDSSGTLILKGEWQLDKGQNISYFFKRKQLTTKTNLANSFVIDGCWQINSSNKLTYYISGSENHKLEFKAFLESPNMYPHDGTIKYRLGAGCKKLKIITLYGEWKFDKKLGLSFEMTYNGGNVNAIKFGTIVNFSKNGNVNLMLVSKSGERLGAELIFTKRLLAGDFAEAFVRLKRFNKGTGADLGVRLPF